MPIWNMTEIAWNSADVREGLGVKGMEVFVVIAPARNIYIYTRVDPCIKCTRSKLSTAQVAAAFVDPTDLLYVCGTV